MYTKKCVNSGQNSLNWSKWANILRSLCWKVHRLEKSKPLTVVTVGTNMSYVAIVDQSWEIILKYYRWLWKNWLKKGFGKHYSLVLKKDVKQWSMIHIHWTASVRPAFGRSGQHKNHSQGSLTFLQKVIRIETLKKSQELRPWKKHKNWDLEKSPASWHPADFPSGSSLCILNWLLF